MKHPTQFVQAFGHMRANERANIEITPDNATLIRFEIFVPNQPGLHTEFILAGQHLYDFHKELSQVVAKAKAHDRAFAAADELRHEAAS